MHREERLGLSTTRQEGGGAQTLPGEGAQIIAHPFFIPDGSRKQSLDPIGPVLFGMLSDLPAIFSGDVAENGLQIEQTVTAGFQSSKTGTQTLMPVVQGQRPPGDLLGGWPDLLVCGMVRMLHAFLVSDGHLKQEVFVLLECHIESENCTECFLSGGGDGSGYK